MSIQNDIPKLIDAGVITKETADKIRDYYEHAKVSSSNRLFIIFGVFGALLVGLGIILILAHNWDQLSRATKVFFAFLPLVLGQMICLYCLLIKSSSTAWRESTATFLFFAVGASISLVSQIYNIPGSLSSFLLTWSLLCFPLMYVMRSSIASLLYIIGITYYASETSYWSYPNDHSYIYWILILGIVPHYYKIYRKNPTSNYITFHNWVVPLSVIITLGTVAEKTGELMFIAYFSLFGLLYLTGRSALFTQQKPINNGYKLLGALGTIILMLVLSFNWFWEDLLFEEFIFHELIQTPEFFASAILTLCSAMLLYVNQKNKPIVQIEPLSTVFIIFIVVFCIGLFSSIAVVLINLLIFAIGVLIIRNGARIDHLGIVNFGLLVITALIVCRFFDTNISFIVRGILFVSVGAGFFIANYWMLKKRKTNE